MLPVPYIVRRMWTVLLIFQSLMICIRGDCGPPPKIDNTLPVEETSGAPGATVVYRCNREAGYYELPDKSRTITCQDDGAWSPFSKFCARACGVPGRISFGVPKDGELDKDIFLPGTTVTYNCVPGYRRVAGSNSITCLNNYTWSEPSEFCVRKQCGHPGDLLNGELTATNDFLFGSKVTYTCNRGYRLTSKRNFRDCLADGKWSNEVPECEAVICPAPDVPANGSYNPVKDQYYYLDAVTFRCKKDLHVIGESTASCNSDGTWSNSSPTCKAVECPDPGQVQNGGRISGFAGPYTLNYAVRFECDKNFVLEGSSSITCTSNNKWDSEIPKCLPVQCPEPGQVQNGRRKPGFDGPYILNYKVEFVCDKNFVLEGSSSITCTSNNKWDSEIPKCLSVQCPEPGQVQNGRRKRGFDGPYILNYKVEFECDDNFVLEGSSSITCTSNNKWDSEIPKCLPISCGDPGHVSNANRSVSHFTIGSTVNYTCHHGYVMTSHISYRECQANGNWSPSEIICSESTSGLSTGAIVGICVACLAALFAFCCLCWCCSKKKSGKAKCDTEVQYTACNDASLRAKEDAMA